MYETALFHNKTLRFDIWIKGNQPVADPTQSHWETTTLAHFEEALVCFIPWVRPRLFTFSIMELKILYHFRNYFIHSQFSEYYFSCHSYVCGLCCLKQNQKSTSEFETCQKQTFRCSNTHVKLLLYIRETDVLLNFNTKHAK